MKYGKITGLIKFDMAYVDSKFPCYPASRYLISGKPYDAVRVLKDDRIPFEDCLWVVLRRDLCSEKLMRLFAVWCARQVQHLMHDPASLNALDAVELYVDGVIDNAAGAAARAAAEAAEEAVVKVAERASAWAAARAAQRKNLIEMFLEEGQLRLAKQKGQK